MLFRLKAYLAAIVAALGGIAAVFYAGKRDARKEARTDQLEDHIETRERIDEVTSTDADSSRSWLHERGKR